MKILFIDSCVRGELSATRRYAEAWLEKYKKESDEIEILRLAEENLTPHSAARLEKRDALLDAGKTDDAMFRYARQFKEADEIVIAAPYWDLSFPALLRIYFENVSVCGITFRYEGAESVGCCAAKTARYFSTCGGFTNGRHLGAEYARALCKMFGIDEFEEYTVEGMDIDTSQRETLLTEAIAKL
ncbi:MAG: NAD(P)H-dependent oxidoreductase [Synergistaceae bacterium]|nr:NAD(P)H-dependent oxidoreductase [Candidatus Equadaptatus faecalis]